MRLALWLAGLGLLLAACGASSQRSKAVAHVEHGQLTQALGVYESSEQYDVLAGIAEAILERDACSVDAAVRQAAFSELSVAGLGARPLLERLAEHGPQAITRASALRGLLQAGSASVRDDLAALVHDADPDVVDVAFIALDAESDRSTLLAGLVAPRSARRAAALAVLSGHLDRALWPAFREVARQDPEPAQRMAAVRALASVDDGALDTVVAALGDADQSVRLAAIAGLVKARREHALSFVSRYLDGAPGPEAIEAAAALLRAMVASEEGRARQVLARALDDKDAALRARAALVIESLGLHELTTSALAVRLAKEGVPEVQLAIALALGTGHAPARAALVALSSNASIVGVQAAAALAATGDTSALERLRAQIKNDRRAVRVTLARVLGSELARPLEVRTLLADVDAAVRRAAAGAVLRSLD